MRALRIVAVAAIAATLALLAFPAYLDLRAMGSKVFEPQTFDFVLLAASTFAIVLGVQLVPWAGQRYVGALALVASGFLLFGFLAAFSIGLPFLAAGLVLLLLLYRALARVPRSRLATRAALGGAATGFGLPLLYIALIAPATVECFANGGGASGGRWRGNSQEIRASGSVGAGANGVVTGRIEYTDSVVTYRCEGGRLVEFQRVPR